MTGTLTVTFNPALDMTSSVGRVEPHIKLRCQGLRYDPGGGGVNVARVMARLVRAEPADAPTPGPIRALYPAGGTPGQRLTALMQAEGIDCLAVPSEAATRQNLTVQETGTGLQYRFLLPGDPLPEEAWSLCLDVIEGIKPLPARVVASGSLPEGAPDDLLAQVAALCRKRGMDFVVDSSGDPLKAALRERPTIVKLNERELREASGEADPEAGAQALLAAGLAETLLVTLGEAGARLYDSERRLKAESEPLEVASAVGAGDSFLAGYLHALDRGLDPGEALRWGVAAADAALVTPGTELCRAEDLPRFFDRVRVEALA